VILSDNYRLGKEDIKLEIKKFVQAIETNYTDALQVLKDKNEKL